MKEDPIWGQADGLLDKAIADCTCDFPIGKLKIHDQSNL